MISQAGLFAARVLAAAAFAAVPAASPAPAGKTAEVQTSTAAPNVSSIYTAEKLRNPFLKTSAGPGAAAKPFTTEDFNIHSLTLRGVMKDAGTSYAVFADSNFGVSFILRRGKLYDSKGKAMRGVSGSLSLKQKSAQLMTQDNDVQIYRLGEEGKD